MRPVCFGAVTFAFIFVGVSIAVAGIGVFQQRAGSTSPGGNLLMAAYLVLAAGGMSTLGFAAVTASSPSWRRQTVQVAVLVSATIGFLAFLLHLSGFASFPLSILFPSPVLRAWPRASAAAFFAFPGILTGLIAVFLAWVRGSRRRPA